MTEILFVRQTKERDVIPEMAKLLRFSNEAIFDNLF